MTQYYKDLAEVGLGRKLHLLAGETVEVMPQATGQWPFKAKILEVDDHLFEYDLLKVEMLDSVAVQAPKLWVSERNVRRS